MISTLVYYALVIAVRADYEAKSLADLIAIAKAKPDDLSFGSVGFGSTHHLAGELLNTTAGIKMVHVPYRGDSLTVTSLLGGDVPVIVGTTVLLAARSRAAPFAASRSPRPPARPAAERAFGEEAGVKGFDVRTWAGLLVSEGHAARHLKRLNAEIQSMLADPAMKTALEMATGGEVRGSTPEDMRALIRSEIAKWSKVINDAGIPRI